MSEGECHVVVSTWGNPLTWGDAVYTVGDVRAESCSSLIALLKQLALKRGFESVVRVYLLGLDSVVDVNQSVFERSRGQLCCRAFEKCFKKHCEGRKLDNYKVLLDTSIELYKCVLRELLLNSKCNGDEPCFENGDADEVLKKTKVVVLPAMGSPGGVWNFKGCPEDYFAKALVDVVPSALKTLQSCTGPVEICFDATHGLNYVPALTLGLVEVLGQLIRLRYGVSVKIIIYNSDPYPPRAVKPELRVNIVYERCITDAEIPYIEKFEVLRSCKTVSSQAPECPSSKQHKMVSKIVRNVASSVYSPAPLALLYACHELSLVERFSKGAQLCSVKSITEILEEYMRGALEKWVSKIRVEGNVVKRPLSMSVDSVWALLFSVAVCGHVHDIAKSRQSSTLTDGYVPAFALELLEELGERVYGSVYSAAKYLINQELSSIREFAEELRKGGVTQGCYEYKKPISRPTGNPATSKSVPERVVIAHAGLPYGYVEVCLRNDNVYLRYASEDALEDVLNKLKNVYDSRLETRLSASSRRVTLSTA